MWVDAFDVASGGGGSTPTPTPLRIEQTDARVTFHGAWYGNDNANNSGGSALLSMEAADSATVTFQGTGASWIGLTDPWSGIANVYVDGVAKATVDTYAAVEKDRVALYSVSGLTPGTHTLRVEPTGTRNSASGGAWVWVDAFDVTP